MDGISDPALLALRVTLLLPLFPEIPHCLAGSPGSQERHGGRAAPLCVREQRPGAPVAAGARGRAPAADCAAHAARGLPAGGGRAENDGEGPGWGREGVWESVCSELGWSHQVQG